MSTIEITIIPGSFHLMGPVCDQPNTVMTHWRLVQVRCTDGRRTRHLVGRADWEGRVCSEIVKFDTQDLRATTKSGRVYKLEGPPGRDLYAEYVFGIWLQGTGYTQEKDMTKALMRLRGLRK